jgi:hypothetical protein
MRVTSWARGTVKLVCDDFAGYKASFELGITEIGCMAHARRKFFDLHAANKSQLAEQALHSIGGLYEVERHAKEMSDEDRWRLRQETAVPIAEKLHEWMLAQRELVPEGSATAKALDYSLKRWVALTRYLEDGAVPIDNNQIENLIRPWALELVICRVAAQWKKGGGNHEPDPVSAYEWARSVCLSQGCADAAAYTAGERNHAITPAALDACLRQAK